MPARLILNADDFGLTPGINRAIAELHQAGALTSTTLMATGPAFEDAASLAHTHPNLGVGCHLVLVDGTPISPPSEISTLLSRDGKTFRTSIVDFTQAGLRGQINPDHLRREAFAQIEKLQRAGIPITHLDTHKHTHLSPFVSRLLLQVAEQANIHAIRNPFEAPWSLALNQGRLLRRIVLRALDRTFRRPFEANLRAAPTIGTPDGSIAVSATGDLTQAALTQILHALPPEGTWELVLHPGYNDAALDQITTRLRATREVEREALQAIIPGLRQNANSPQLIHYGDLSHLR